jgi:hypothetical protein
MMPLEVSSSFAKDFAAIMAKGQKPSPGWPISHMA